MRSRWSLVFWISALSAVSVESAEEPLSPVGRLLQTHVNRPRLEIVLGRVAAFSGRYGFSGKDRVEQPGPPADELLIIDASGGEPSLSYAYRHNLLEVSVEIRNGRAISIHWLPRQRTGPAVHYEQPSHGAVELIATGKVACRAATLWHLWFGQPETCRQYLGPLLQVLRPDWRFDEQAAAVARLVLEQPPPPHSSGDTDWRQLVDELRSSDFARRQSATRQLRQAGPRVMTLLDNLDPATLDAEQRYRLRALRQTVGRPRRDTPEQVAEWLGNDPSGYHLVQRSGIVSQQLRLARQPTAAATPAFLLTPAARNSAAQEKEKQRTTVQERR